MIYNRVRRKPLLRDYLSGGFLLWMHFVKHRELLRVEFPNCTHISFETGGHLMVGHEEEVKKAVMEFITFSSRATRPKV